MDLQPGKQFLKQKIKELKQQCYEIIEQNAQGIHNHIITQPRLDALNRRIRDYEFYLKPVQTDQGQDITDLDISRAREYPITQLYEGKLRKSGARLFGSCPFHSEKHASFVVYPENKYHCFGCLESGDSIAYVMKENNIKFLDAVKLLITK